MHHKLYHRPGPNTEPQTAGFVRPILAHAMTYQLSHKGGLLQGHPLPTPAKFSRHLFPHSSVILFTEWQTERSYDLRLVGGGNYIALRGSKPLPTCQPQPEVIRETWLVIGECMRNANKSPKIPYSAMVREVEKWSGIRIQDWIIIDS